MWLWLLVNDCQISFDCELNIKAWFWVEYQSLVDHQKCVVLTDIPRSVVLQIFAQRPNKWPCYICIQINAIQLHFMIFSKSMAGMIYWNQQKKCHLWSHSIKSNHCTQITLWFMTTLIWVCLGKMWGPRNLTGANHIFSVYPQAVAEVYLYVDIIVQNTHNWWRHTTAE